MPVAKNVALQTRCFSSRSGEAPQPTLSRVNDKRPAYRPPVIRLYIASMVGGGSERVCTTLCNGFVSKGLGVELLLVNGLGPYLSRLDSQVRIVDFKVSRGLKALMGVSRHLRCSPSIPTLVFGFNLAAAVVLARRIGLHNSSIIYREASWPKAYIRPWQRFGYRWAIGQVDWIVAQSRAASDELAKLGLPKKNIVVIPNPFVATGDRTERVARFSKDAPLIIGVGRLCAEKRFDRLIRAFFEFRKQCPKARLAILGEGGERPCLEQLIKSLHLAGSVMLPGFVENLSPWYDQASLFAMSSSYEGQPNALIEAIMHNCPVITIVNSGGTIELMRDIGLEDCLVSDESFDLRFADQARRAITMDDSRWQRAREKVARLTDIETVMLKYLDLCEIKTGQTVHARS